MEPTYHCRHCLRSFFCSAELGLAVENTVSPRVLAKMVYSRASSASFAEASQDLSKLTDVSNVVGRWASAAQTEDCSRCHFNPVILPSHYIPTEADYPNDRRGIWTGASVHSVIVVGEIDMRRWSHSPFLILATLVVTSGCRVGPEPFSPLATVPDAWSQPVDERVSIALETKTAWWTVFRDPVLNRLIAEASEQNLDLRESVSRILEVRAQRGIVRGGFLPDIDSTTSYSRNKISANGNPFGIRNLPGSGFDISQPFDLFSTGIDASWEIDVFGRVKRSLEATDADLAVSIEDYKAVAVTLLADVASNYSQLRTLQQRIAIAQNNVRIQSATLELTEDRFRVGTISELDVAQAKANLRNTEAAIPAFRSQLRSTANRLCVLRGQHPRDLTGELGGVRPIPTPPPEVVIDLPVALLGRRPDVVRAERDLEAQTARVGVAVADLYPRFSLTGTFTVDAADFSKLFTSDSIAYRLFGPSVRWNLLDFGRVRSNIAVQDERFEQALLRYDKTVLSAIEEVENALTAYLEQLQRLKYLDESVESARRAEELARTQYLKGATSFQSLLDAQKFLLLVEEQQVATRGNVNFNLIALYKALGGGWAAIAGRYLPEGEIIHPGVQIE